MRFKNFTLVFLMGLFGLFTTNLFAQDDATIDPSEIRYWIGEGENEVVFIVNWNEPDTALAWGYRFNGESITVKDMMDEIAETDYRFAYEGTGYVSQITFNDGILDLSLAGMWWMYIVNGEMAQVGFSEQTVTNGDYVKWGDESCGILLDPVNYVYVWTKEVAPVYPLAEEAMIDFSEILYWIGEGEHEVVFCVNWAEPNKALAWGYRFSTDDVTVKTVMDAIVEADARFDYEAYGSYVNDITLHYKGVDFALTGSYFMYNINGGMAWYGYDEQTVVDGDFIKFGDISCATEIGQWTYVWTTLVEPIEAYDGVAEESLNGVSVYPNPATDYALLSVGDLDAEATVTVTDLQGRVLSSFNMSRTDEPVRIETSGLGAGMYFVTVSDGTNRQTVKLSVR